MALGQDNAEKKAQRHVAGWQAGRLKRHGEVGKAAATLLAAQADSKEGASRLGRRRRLALAVQCSTSTTAQTCLAPHLQVLHEQRRAVPRQAPPVAAVPPVRPQRLPPHAVLLQLLL
jgi:hypothetical protein